MGGGAIALLASLGLAAPVVGVTAVATARDDGCLREVAPITGTAKLRLRQLLVDIEDPNGQPVDGAVEIDGALVGRTGRPLRVPACPGRLRVVAGTWAWEQTLPPPSPGALTIRMRLGTVVLSEEAVKLARREEPTPPSAAAPAAATPTAKPPVHASVDDPTRLNLSENRLPGGKAAVHYHRPDGQYGGWMLTSWEDGNGPDRRMLPGASWDHPMKPSGQDGFGVYWLLPTAEYANNHVNFVIHRRAERENCGEDTYFNYVTSREAWVVAGQCDHFRSRQEALEFLAQQRAAGK